MMGTLAGVLAAKKIPTPEDRYWADVEGDIENVNGVLKANGCAAEMLRYPHSPHSAASDGAFAVRRAHNEALVEWMDRWVLGKG